MIRYSGVVRLLCLVLLLVSVAGCGRLFKRDDPLETLPVEEMYGAAKSALESGNLGRAERYYTRLIARFPYGTYTEQAQIELAYTQYKDGKSEDASSTINRFIKTYPAHRNTVYAYYLKALINFDRENSFLDRVARIDRTMRDQGSLRQSFNDFAELIRRYPNSHYAVDARQRMVHLRNLLARYEVNIGKYYLRRGAYVAAVKRGQYVLEYYPQTGYQGDALAIMAESYHQLGQDKLSEDAKRVLERNEPEHPYLSGNWPDRKSWWRRLIPLSGESSS